MFSHYRSFVFLPLVVCTLVAIHGCSLMKDDSSPNPTSSSNTDTDNTTDSTTDSTTSGTTNNSYVPDSGEIPVPTSPYADSTGSTVVTDLTDSTGSTTTSGSATAIGSDAVSDGSAARLELYGIEQYFWGDPGTGESVPLVKIETAVTNEVVDAAIVFNPTFVDLSYGTGSEGWSPKRGHTFNDLVGSDHVEVCFINGDGDTVLHAKLDLISPTDQTTSGYASLGLGGDGELMKGDASSILSFGTSMDDNLNVAGWTDLENSPSTDSTFARNASAPDYNFFAVYRISIDPAAFGPSGYGEVRMTSVHASPAKTPSETITVTDGPEPPASEDPWAPGDDGSIPYAPPYGDDGSIPYNPDDSDTTGADDGGIPYEPDTTTTTDTIVGY